MENIHDTEFLRYCCKDTLSTYLTTENLLPEVKEEKMLPFYNSLVQPLAETLCRINNGGVKFDYKNRDKVAAILQEDIDLEYKQLDDMLGEHIPVNPSDELIHFIYNKIGTPVLLKTNTGAPSTSKDALIDLGKEHPDLEPIFTSILNLRLKTKALNDFVLNAKVLADGRVYPYFKISPVSGRLACAQPNVQQIPDVAKALYVADPGYNFLYADLDQAEICIIAILAQDKVWLACIKRGEKVHKQNAIDLYGFPADHKVTTLEKKVAKGFQFGQNYGQTMDGAYDKLRKLIPNLERKRFDEMVTGFYKKHPGLVQYKENISIEVKTTSAVKGIFGRTRKLFRPYDKSYRAALNHPMQNGVGDFINKKLIALDRLIPRPDFNLFQAEFSSAIRLQIHDAIILMVKEKDTEKYAEIFNILMTQPVPELNNFSFTADVEVGKSWMDFVHD